MSWVVSQAHLCHVTCPTKNYDAPIWFVLVRCAMEMGMVKWACSTHSGLTIHDLYSSYTLLRKKSFFMDDIFPPFWTNTQTPWVLSNTSLTNSRLQRRNMLSIVESVDWWDWCTQRPLSTPSVSTGEVKMLSLSSSTPITYSQTAPVFDWCNRETMSTINGAISSGLSSAARSAVCTLNGIPAV